MSDFIHMLQKQTSEYRGARTAQVFAELNSDYKALNAIAPSYWAQKSMLDKQSTNLYGLGNRGMASNLYADKNAHTEEVNSNPFAGK